MPTRIRFVIDNVQGGVSHSNVAIAELELRSIVSGVDETTNTGGTATASGNIGSSFVASKAIDDNTATMWNSGFTAGSTWWEFEFSSSINVVEYTITSRSSFLNDCPTEWLVQVHNGVDWQTMNDQDTPADWSATETRTFNADTLGLIISPASGLISLAGQELIISLPVSISLPTASLVINGYNPSIGISEVIAVSNASITINGLEFLAPAIRLFDIVSGNLVVKGQALLVATWGQPPVFELEELDSVPRAGPKQFSGHWHEGQEDDPEWEFVEQPNLPIPYHEHPTKAEVCGHWHKPVALITVPSPRLQERWTYPVTQFNSPYMYCLEIPWVNAVQSFPRLGINAVIKLDISQTPPVAVERLILRAEYGGLFNPYAINDQQQGSYCISKSGKRIFYILRHYEYHFNPWFTSLPDAELVEISTEGELMQVIKLTKFSDTSLFVNSGERVIDAQATDEHSYWLTNYGRIIQIANGGHEIVRSVAVLGVDPVYSFDIHVATNNIYHGSYKPLGFHEPPNSTYYRLSSDLELINSGIGYPNNHLRVLDDQVFCDTHIANLTTRGYILVADLGFNFSNAYNTLGTNIHNVHYIYPRLVDGNKLMVSNVLNNFDIPVYLYSLQARIGMAPISLPGDLDTLSQLDIKYYGGQGWLIDYDWQSTAESGLCWTAPIIAHVRYKYRDDNTGTGDVNKNWIASFSASSLMTVLSDSAIEYPANSHYGNVSTVVEGEHDPRWPFEKSPDV